MTEQDFTKKILKKAEQQAKALVSAAEQQSAAQITAAKEDATARQKAALARGKADLEYRQTEQQRAHEVAMIKAQINAQQAWVDTAFNTAREKLVHASAAEIKQIVDTFTQKYAGKDDQLIIAANWAHAFPKLPTTTAIAGGLIIETPTYRLELDIDSILAELREPLAPTIAKMLGVL